MRKPHRRFSLVHITLLCALIVMSSFVLFPIAAHADTTSVVIPMSARAATDAEVTGMEAFAGQKAYAQVGSEINKNFTETATPNRTGRVWVIEAKPSLESCDSNVTFSIEGNHKVRHNANSAQLVVAGDEPEVGGLVVDGGSRGLLINSVIASTSDLGIGQSIDVTAPTTAVSVDYASSGIKALIYVETRDDQAQHGVQASFTYSGTALLRITYDHSGCTTTTQATNPTTTVKKATTTTKKSTTKKSTATTATTVPTEVQGTSVENNAFALGNKTSIASSKNSIIQNKPTKKAISIPHAKASQGNTLVNAATFGFMIMMLAVGMSLFILKQRRMRKLPHSRGGGSNDQIHWH